MITEIQKRVFSGLAMLLVLFALQGAAVWFLVESIRAGSGSEHCPGSGSQHDRPASVGRTLHGQPE